MSSMGPTVKVWIGNVGRHDCSGNHLKQLLRRNGCNVHSVEMCKDNAVAGFWSFLDATMAVCLSHHPDLMVRNSPLEIDFWTSTPQAAFAQLVAPVQPGRVPRLSPGTCAELGAGAAMSTLQSTEQSPRGTLEKGSDISTTPGASPEASPSTSFSLVTPKEPLGGFILGEETCEAVKEVVAGTTQFHRLASVGTWLLQRVDIVEDLPSPPGEGQEYEAELRRRAELQQHAAHHDGAFESTTAPTLQSLPAAVGPSTCALDGNRADASTSQEGIWLRRKPHGGTRAEEAMYLLGLSDSNEIHTNLRGAYKKAATESHPDKPYNHARKAEATLLFQRVQDAYELLGKASEVNRGSLCKAMQARDESLACALVRGDVPDLNCTFKLEDGTKCTLLQMALLDKLPRVALALAEKEEFEGLLLRSSTGLLALHMAAFRGYEDVCRSILSREPRLAAARTKKESQMGPRRFPAGILPADFARRGLHMHLASSLSAAAQSL